MRLHLWTCAAAVVVTKHEILVWSEADVDVDVYVADAVVVVAEPFASSEIPNITQFRCVCPISFNVILIE